jgi:inner membrane protein YidH
MKEDSTLNKLARNRTVLANERTFLAYIRTSIMFAVSGITLIKFYGRQTHFLFGGIVLLAAAVAFAGLGFLKYRAMGKRVARTMPELDDESDG